MRLQSLRLELHAKACEAETRSLLAPSACGLRDSRPVATSSRQLSQLCPGGNVSSRADTRAAWAPHWRAGNWWNGGQWKCLEKAWWACADKLRRTVRPSLFRRSERRYLPWSSMMRAGMFCRGDLERRWRRDGRPLWLLQRASPVRSQRAEPAMSR